MPYYLKRNDIRVVFIPAIVQLTRACGNKEHIRRISVIGYPREHKENIRRWPKKTKEEAAFGLRRERWIKAAVFKKTKNLANFLKNC